MRASSAPRFKGSGCSPSLLRHTWCARRSAARSEESSAALARIALHINPAASSIKWLEGLGQYHQGNFEQASNTLAIALDQAPYHFRTLNDYAGCLVQLKKYHEAVPLYLKALFINPKFEEGMFNLAYAYAQLHQFEESLKWVNMTSGDAKKKADFISEIDKMKNEPKGKN